MHNKRVAKNIGEYDDDKKGKHRGMENDEGTGCDKCVHRNGGGDGKGLAVRMSRTNERRCTNTQS